MLSSLSSGVSGLESFQQQMNVIGNNIANVNTTGFKAASVDFSDSFSNTIQGGGPTQPSDQVGTGVGIAAITNNWSQGGLVQTGVASNVAVSGSGNGFFTVTDPISGANYATQDGSFRVNNTGELVTSHGDLVQGYNDAALSTVGNITIAGTTANPMKSYTIDSQGVITMTLADNTTQIAGQILLQNYNDPQMLVSEGNNLYSNITAAGPISTTTTVGGTPGSQGLGTIQSGAVESSNVDLSNEMANLITAQRAFEANSKIITTSNEVLQTLVQLKQN